MKMQWEKLPDRLYSESLKCLMCNIMRRYIKEEGAMLALSHCCAYMTRALTIEDDKAFTEDAETLMKSLDGWLDTRAPKCPPELEAFLETHAEYIKDRTREVLDRAKACPELRKERA